MMCWKRGDYAYGFWKSGSLASRIQMIIIAGSVWRASEHLSGGIGWVFDNNKL